LFPLFLFPGVRDACIHHPMHEFNYIELLEIYKPPAVPAALPFSFCFEICFYKSVYFTTVLNFVPRTLNNKKQICGMSKAYLYSEESFMGRHRLRVSTQPCIFYRASMETKGI
jgi:hypothetical protein